MDQEKIGKKIKEIRTKNNLTQQEFASIYNVTYQAVSKWENGKNLPDISLLKQISKDYNITLDELINEKQPNKNKKQLLILIPLITIIVFLSIILIYKDDNFNFKKITSECENFTLHGSIAYNKNIASIYISNIEYCGEETLEEYKKIECTLYEKHNNTNTKITECNYKENQNTTLEEFLKNVTFTVDNYERVCKNYEKENLYLEINATNKKDITTTYKIPLSLDENCE